MPDDLGVIAADFFEFRMRTGPTSAHMLGDYRYAGEFERASRAAEDAEIAEARAIAERAAAIPAQGLGTQDLITRDMLLFDALANADYMETRLREIDVDPIHGPQALLPVIVRQLTLPSAEVAEAMLGKYAGIAQMFDDLGERHREGLGRGRTPADYAVRQSLDQLDAWLATPAAEDPLLELAEPAGLDDPDAWRNRLCEAIGGLVRPALARYRDVLRTEIMPHVRPNERCGLVWLADGEQAYNRAIRLYTTLPLGAQEIHELGLQQVERLADEYRALGPQALGTGDLARILSRLRSDPALHHETGEAVVAAAKTALAKARSATKDWFGILPKADCDVEETKGGAQAFYFPPAQDGSRGGVFFMNTANPSSWGRYDIESTSYHEGIPGHHLQIAIASELDELPAFRRHGFIAAFDEGWGLYAERLADEMDLYSSPLDRLGLLAGDSLRACRLVVDTGMHALGWSRDRAIAYLVENSPMTEERAQAEIDRYGTSPGQALSYMVGRLEIQRIRAEAEKSLGALFDIRSFHDAVIGSGPMPLPTLARVVGEWVEATRTAG